MSEVENTRIDDHGDGHPGEDVHVGVSVAYRKPRLRRLGVWNVFTRATSVEDADGGFFEFEVR